MVPLRLCYLILDCLFDEKCDLPTSPYNDLHDTVLSGFNVSLISKRSSLQSPTNESVVIDECLLSLQRNESDVALFPYTMPVMMSNIRTGAVFFSDKIAIASTYKVLDQDANPGVFATFDAFGVDVVALILNFFVILTALISLTYILERKSASRRVRINGRRFNLRYVPWFVFRFFVKQYPSFPGNMTVLKVLLTCCLLTFSNYVTFFYSTLIKTDMVTVKAPEVIATYQDIVDDHEIEPYIRHSFDEYISFKDAAPGSPKRKIWERILKMGVDKHVFGSDWDKEDIVFYDLRHPFMNSKAVIMAYASTTHFVEYLFGVVLKGDKKRKMLLVSDPTDSTKLSANVFNRFTDDIIFHKYQVQMRRLFEGHFWYEMVDNAALLWVKYYADLLGLDVKISNAAEYVSHKVLLSDPELVKPNIIYFMFLFILYLVFCVIQLIVFLTERLVSKKK